MLGKGLEEWNKWRLHNRTVRPDLGGASLQQLSRHEANLLGEGLHEEDLVGINFSGVDFEGANLSGTDFYRADFRDANLKGVNLSGASLGETCFRGANLRGANLNRTQFNGADLQEADLGGSDIRGARLSRARLIATDFAGASLAGAFLGGAFFLGANLKETDLSYAKLGWTGFLDVDLSSVKGLTSVEHQGPSSITIETLYISGSGNIPEQFLLAAGVPRDFLDYLPPSLRGSAIDFYSCFISYSGKDEEFARRLHADLKAENVRVWFAPENLKIGDRTRRVIHDSIRLYDKLLIVLTENSVESDWVEEEVEAALQKERREKSTVLFPIRLDDAVMDTHKAWAETVRDRHIGDFRNWKDHDSYRAALERLLRDLRGAEPSTD